MAGVSIRAVARAMMPGWANRALSAAQVTQELVGMFGQAYRRTTLLADYREARGVVLKEVPISRLRMATELPRSLLTETTLRRPRRYLVKAKASFEGDEPGEIIERHISWYTDEAKSKEQMIEEYLKTMAPKFYPEADLPFEIRVRAVLHNEGLGY